MIPGDGRRSPTGTPRSPVTGSRRRPAVPRRRSSAPALYPGGRRRPIRRSAITNHRPRSQRSPAPLLTPEGQATHPIRRPHSRRPPVPDGGRPPQSGGQRPRTDGLPTVGPGHRSRPRTASDAPRPTPCGRQSPVQGGGRRLRAADSRPRPNRPRRRSPNPGGEQRSPGGPRRHVRWNRALRPTGAAGGRRGWRTRRRPTPRPRRLDAVGAQRAIYKRIPTCAVTSIRRRRRLTLQRDKRHRNTGRSRLTADDLQTHPHLHRHEHPSKPISKRSGAATGVTTRAEPGSRGGGGGLRVGRGRAPVVGGRPWVRVVR